MIGIIGAMDIEIEHINAVMEEKEEFTVSGALYTKGTIDGKDVVTAVCGIGKVFAAMCAQTMIVKFGADTVINTGVAGGLTDKTDILDTVVATALVQHDMDTSPLGDPVGLVSGINVIRFPADDRMYTELSRFFNKTLTDVALINCLSALDLGKQYVAISEKACKQIKILKEEPLSQLELSLLKDMSAERRKEGIALAEEIEVKYRREGKFFDEILKGE